MTTLTNLQRRLKVLSAERISDVAEGRAYAVARAGGRHAGLLRLYQEKNTAEVRRALRSYDRQVERHRQKIHYPAAFVTDWDKRHPRVQHGLLRHWQEDIVRNQELADIMRGILQARGIQ